MAGVVNLSGFFGGAVQLISLSDIGLFGIAYLLPLKCNNICTLL